MKRAFAIASLLAATLNAQATDGVIEINQAKVNAAGGFPYVISQAGSYRLTGNLTVPDANTNGIDITVAGVSIDLNGFSIIGPNVCPTSGAMASCSATGSGIGINDLSPGVTVKNGQVRGAGRFCVFMSDRGRIENADISHCGSHGIAAPWARVSASRAMHCLGQGIQARDVTDSLADHNGAGGFLVYRSITASIASDNRATGITALAGSTVVVGNSSSSNLGWGLDAPSTAGISQNVLYSNTGTKTGGAVSMPANSNLCDGSPC
jgi:hypothetical protein